MKKGFPEDPETLKKYEELLNNGSLTWKERLDKLFEFKKKQGLNNFHCTYDGKQIMNEEDLSKFVFMMMYNGAKGKYEEYEPGDVL